MKSTRQTGVHGPLLAAALMLAGSAVHAAGMGRITVRSPLGQPLRAEVDITASREELASMSARMAPSEAFKQVGIEYVPGVAAIRFAVDKRADGQPFLRLSTDRPVNEPFLDILVELTWSSGRMVREYTILLDPPDVFSKPAVVAPAIPPEAKPVPAEKPAAKPAPQEESSGASKAAKAESSAPAADAGTSPRERKVSPGDTLTKIAADVVPAGVGLDQMLVALFRANEDAFAGGNMNRLRVGKILTVPDTATASAIPAGEAHATVMAQARDFNAYRQKLAGAVAGAGADEEVSSRQRAEGKIAAKVEAKAATAERSQDKLEVSRTESGKDVKAFQQRITVLEEDLIARDRSLKDAGQRIAELEKNLADLKKLAELKSQVGAQMQQKAESAGAGKESAAKAAEPIAKPPAQPTEPVAQTPAKPVEPQQTAAEPQTAPASSKPAAPKPKPPVVAKPKEQPGFLDENATLVYGSGGVIALLLGWLGYSSWRRKRQEEAVPTTSGLGPANLATNSVFGSTGGQAVDTGASIQTDFSQASLGVVDSDEGVDPVAEADVYMAYGRDVQAEEILVDALKNDPTRHAIYLKLLEIYSGRKSVKQFESLATDFYAQTGGSGADWDTAAALGRALDPANKLYGGSGGGEGASPAVEPAPIVLPSAETDKLSATVTLPGQLGRMAKAAKEVEPAQAAPLDFDLDVTSFSAPEPHTSVGGGLGVSPGAPASPISSLDFDTAIGTGGAESRPVAPPVEHLDFDLALPQADAMSPPPLKMPEPAIGAGDIDFEFDIQAPPQADSPPAAQPKTPAFDLSSIDLDLDVPPAAADSAQPIDEENPDIATKLELAQAYEEMGDKEGARELLQEVVHEGRGRQQQMARERLASLDA